MLAVIAFVLMASTAIFQSIYVHLYSRRLRRSGRIGDLQSGEFPLAAIVMCLRGSDPSLPDTLKAIGRLDYPQYELHLVFDSQTDSSLPVVDRCISGLNRELKIQKHFLDPREVAGSLKCQSICHALRELVDRVDVVALLDADSVVSTNWLKELVVPLDDPAIGATTGNRWFAPDDNRLGSWLRQIWNAAAIVQMELYGIAWGGSLAFKSSTIQRSSLLRHWQGAFCEDTMLNRVFEAEKLQVKRVPAVVINNRESIGTRDAAAWIGRQLLTVKLYHQSWFLVFGHALTVGLCFFAPLLVAATGFFYQPGISRWLLASWLVFQGVNLLLLWKIGVTNRAASGAQQDKHPFTTLGRACYLGAFLLSQAIQPWAAMWAAFTTSVRWRSIDYKIRRDQSVEMVEYGSFGESDQSQSIS